MNSTLYGVDRSYTAYGSTYNLTLEGLTIEDGSSSSRPVFKLVQNNYVLGVRTSTTVLSQLNPTLERGYSYSSMNFPNSVGSGSRALNTFTTQTSGFSANPVTISSY